LLVVYCVAPDSVVCGLVVHVWQLTIAADVLGVGQACAERVPDGECKGRARR
jgi:hypothetical protein